MKSLIGTYVLLLVAMSIVMMSNHLRYQKRMDEKSREVEACRADGTKRK